MAKKTTTPPPPAQPELLVGREEVETETRGGIDKGNELHESDTPW